MKIGSLATTAIFGLAVTAATAVTAADITVLSIPFRAPMDQIGPRFERATGHRLVIKYAPSAPLLRRIESGEPFDVVLIFPGLVDELIRQKKVRADSRVDIARAGLGLAVKRGAPKPGISSADEFKQVLLRSKSIAYAAQGPSGLHLAGLLDRLGIAQDVKPKLKPMEAGSLVVGPVARGEVEIGIVSVPFILADPGAELAGPLPPELQDYVRYSAGIGSTAHDVDAAKAFITFLRQAGSVEVLKSNGLEAEPQ